MELVEELLGVGIPAHTDAQVAESGTPDAKALTYQADLVVVLRDTGRPVLAVVLEVQLRVDPRKKRTWPHYLTAVGAELDCPAVVLVVTPNEVVQRWAAQPILVGLGHNVITPFVLGPALIPWPRGDAAAAHPELAVLSALAHRDHPRGLSAAQVALGAVGRLDEDLARTYTNFVLGALSEAARAEMERMMREDPQYSGVDYVQQWMDRARQEGVVAGRQEGRQEANRSALARLTRLRFGDLGADVEARIAAGSSEELEVWLERVITAESIEGVFAD